MASRLPWFQTSSNQRTVSCLFCSSVVMECGEADMVVLLKWDGRSIQDRDAEKVTGMRLADAIIKTKRRVTQRPQRTQHRGHGDHEMVWPVMELFWATRSAMRPAERILAVCIEVNAG